MLQNPKEVKTCPVCIQKGDIINLELCQINLTEALYICKQQNCTYPKDYQSIIVERDILAIPYDDTDTTEDAIDEITKMFMEKAIQEEEMDINNISEDLLEKAFNMLVGTDYLEQKNKRCNVSNMVNNDNVLMSIVDKNKNIDSKPFKNTTEVVMEKIVYNNKNSESKIHDFSIDDNTSKDDIKHITSTEFRNFNESLANINTENRTLDESFLNIFNDNKKSDSSSEKLNTSLDISFNDTVNNSFINEILNEDFGVNSKYADLNIDNSAIKIIDELKDGHSHLEKNEPMKANETNINLSNLLLKEENKLENCNLDMPNQTILNSLDCKKTRTNVSNKKFEVFKFDDAHKNPKIKILSDEKVNIPVCNLQKPESLDDELNTDLFDFDLNDSTTKIDSSVACNDSDNAIIPNVKIEILGNPNLVNSVDNSNFASKIKIKILDSENFAGNEKIEEFKHADSNKLMLSDKFIKTAALSNKSLLKKVNEDMKKPEIPLPIRKGNNIMNLLKQKADRDKLMLKQRIDREQKCLKNKSLLSKLNPISNNIINKNDKQDAVKLTLTTAQISAALNVTSNSNLAASFSGFNFETKKTDTNIQKQKLNTLTQLVKQTNMSNVVKPGSIKKKIVLYKTKDGQLCKKNGQKVNIVKNVVNLRNNPQNVKNNGTNVILQNGSTHLTQTVEQPNENVNQLCNVTDMQQVEQQALNDIIDNVDMSVTVGENNMEDVDDWLQSLLS